jgi:hypothetical protein
MTSLCFNTFYGLLDVNNDRDAVRDVLKKKSLSGRDFFQRPPMKFSFGWAPKNKCFLLIYSIILFNYRFNLNHAYIISYNYKLYSYIILIKCR